MFPARLPPLARDPGVERVTLPLLVGVATAVEDESVRRYEALAAEMARRGNAATAAAFRAMLGEERRHVDAVAHWAAALGEAAPAGAATHFEWLLPADLSTSWDEIAGSALLTPYRAFAIAVDNEQRAFALYSYLAAAAADEPRVAAEAERLAHEELRHAALMRRWRRQAYHRERLRPLREPAPAVESAGALQALLQRHEAAIAARHRAIAARLRALGDADGAALLESLQPSPATTAASSPALPAESDAATMTDDPVHLLTAAQEPLEALSETLEDVMRTLDGELFAQAEQALAGVVARLARIGLRTARSASPHGAPSPMLES